jgi:hypothetical protein
MSFGDAIAVSAAPQDRSFGAYGITVPQLSCPFIAGDTRRIVAFALFIVEVPSPGVTGHPLLNPLPDFFWFHLSPTVAFSNPDTLL